MVLKHFEWAGLGCLKQQTSGNLALNMIVLTKRTWGFKKFKWKTGSFNRPLWIFDRGFDMTKVATRDSFFRNSGICDFNQPWNGDLVNMIFGIEIATFDRFPLGVPFHNENSCKSTCLMIRIS